MRSCFLFLATCGAVALIPSSTPLMRQATAAFATPAGWSHSPHAKSIDLQQHNAVLKPSHSACDWRRSAAGSKACRTAQNHDAAIFSPVIAPPKTVRAGDQIQPGHLHEVTRPGLYGLGRPPKGHSYGIITGKLVRYNFQTKQILSVIRAVDEIYD